MKIDPSVIDTAVAHYAVLLNRPTWLNPDHRELQRTVWLDLVDLFSAGRVGKLHVDDFAAAVVGLIGDGSTSAQSVLPSVIVTNACQFAANRGALARERIDQTDELLIYTETARFADELTRARGNGPAAVAAAIARYREDVEAVRALLIDSGYDDDVINPRLSKIDDLESTTLELATALGRVPLAAAVKPSTEDVAKVEELMRNGVN